MEFSYLDSLGQKENDSKNRKRKCRKRRKLKKPKEWWWRGGVGDLEEVDVNVGGGIVGVGVKSIGGVGGGGG